MTDMISSNDERHITKQVPRWKKSCGSYARPKQRDATQLSRKRRAWEDSEAGLGDEFVANSSLGQFHPFATYPSSFAGRHAWYDWRRNMKGHEEGNRHAGQQE